jgi:circadian clock protein KaiC
MAHSNQVREFIVTERGVELLDVVLGPTGIVTGASRLTQQLLERAQELAARQEGERRDRELERRRRMLEANIANLRTEFESVEEELRLISSTEEQNRQQAQANGKNGTAAKPDGPQKSGTSESRK